MPKKKEKSKFKVVPYKGKPRGPAKEPYPTSEEMEEQLVTVDDPEITALLQERYERTLELERIQDELKKATAELKETFKEKARQPREEARGMDEKISELLAIADDIEFKLIRAADNEALIINLQEGYITEKRDPSVEKQMEAVLKRLEKKSPKAFADIKQYLERFIQQTKEVSLSAPKKEIALYPAPEKHKKEGGIWEGIGDFFNQATEWLFGASLSLDELIGAQEEAIAELSA